MVRFAFQATNNIVEYEVLVLGLSIAKIMGATKVKVKADLLLVNQV